MSVSLKNLVSGVELMLPPELFWSDEFKWAKVKGVNNRTITGGLSVQVGVAVGGRPFTLTAPNDMCWIKRSLLETLMSWSELPTLKMELRLNYAGVPERVFTVSFNHAETPIEAEPVNAYESPLPDDEFTVTLRLMESVTNDN